MLVDDTGFSVRLTVWGNNATSFDAPLESVVAFKGLRVSDFGGRSLSLLSSGSMNINPDIDEAHKLKGWYDAQGRTESFNTHQSLAGGAGPAGGTQDPVITIAQVRDDNLGMSEKADFFVIKATIVYIKQDNVFYEACLSAECNKKVVKIDDEGWRCERCNITHPKPERRYIMSLNVCDHTGQLWLSCFDDVGRMILGMSADSLNELRENEDPAALKVFEEATCRELTFRCRAKMDTWQDQQK
jgi:replication factor A1